VSEDPPGCGLGNRLSLAEQSGFFCWFCLSAVGADEPPLSGQLDGARAGRRFRPSGPRFHHLVELTLDLDESTCITAARLRIARSFIDEPAIRPFARDIAKSFLGWVLPTAAELALRQQIALIGTFADGESVVICHRDSPRPRWLDHLVGRGNEAAVFMGRRTRSKRRIGRIRITFENHLQTAQRSIDTDRAGEASSLATAGRERWLLIHVSGERAGSARPPRLTDGRLAMRP